MRSILFAVFLLFLTGCALTAGQYQQPEVDLPVAWQQGQRGGSAGSSTGGSADGSADGSAIGGDRWWQEFADPKLDRLMTAAMERNFDLARAALTLRQARLRADLSAGDLWPTLSLSGGFDASRRYGSDGGSDKSFSAKTGISYEADLFGRLAAVRDADEWRAEATAYDLDATRLALQATLVNQYFQLAAIRERLRLSAASIEYAEKTLTLTRAQYAAGAAGVLEMLEAERALANQFAGQQSLQQNEVAARQTLALLFGEAQDNVPLEELGDLMAALVPETAPGLPAAILGRRPDLRATEARLRASLAAADAARLNLYPRLTLTGAFGGASEDLSRILANPVASLGAGLILPFVEWRQLRRNLAISETDYALAIVTFRQNLYQALSEVNTCLSAAENLEKQGGQIETVLNAARRSEKLYETRYRAGAVPLQSWLDAQERRRQAEMSLTENKLQRLINQADLAKALGGGAGGR